MGGTVSGTSASTWATFSDLLRYLWRRWPRHEATAAGPSPAPLPDWPADSAILEREVTSVRQRFDRRAFASA
jgi:hypothetical protein